VKSSRKKKIASGLLLHITSLPSKYGIGDLGPEAYKFADFLSKAKQTFWQVLPLNPTLDKSNYSPYNCTSTFAGNTMLISPEILYQQSLLKIKEISTKLVSKTSKVDYKSAYAYKQNLFKIAFRRFRDLSQQQKFAHFCSKNDYWLEDYAMFSVLGKRLKGQTWYDWPRRFRDRDKATIELIKIELDEQIQYEKFLQYLFFHQWTQLKKYCKNKGIKIIGDIPIYVSFNSADIWSNPEYFKLTKSKKPQFISGVPPDLFSSTGQLWNNPLYDWRSLKNDDFEWWVRRIKHTLDMFDLVRIDHFRGFVAYWQLAAGSKTAVNGKWIKGPSDDFFKTLFKHVNLKSIIAEDLGYITPTIRKYINKYGLTGMRVLQFGFGKNFFRSPHFPDNLKANCILYTGTHDNNTIKGWFEKEIDERSKKRIFDCIGHKVSSNQIHWEMIHMAMDSIAKMIIIPVQDVLGLGTQARINHPGKTRGNWRWRLKPGQLTSKHALKLATLTCKYNRS
jgi:4-alpha-glucanotransferase